MAKIKKKQAVQKSKKSVKGSSSLKKAKTSSLQKNKKSAVKSSAKKSVTAKKGIGSKPKNSSKKKASTTPKTNKIQAKVVQAKKNAKGSSSKAPSTLKAKEQPTKGVKFQLQSIKPLDDRIVIVVKKTAETRTTSGLILLSSAGDESVLRGQVVSVGRGHRDKKGRIKPVIVRVGDWVLINSYAGTEVHSDQDVKVIIARETEVLGLSEDLK